MIAEESTQRKENVGRKVNTWDEEDKRNDDVDEKTYKAELKDSTAEIS